MICLKVDYNIFNPYYNLKAVLQNCYLKHYETAFTSSEMKE